MYNRFVRKRVLADFEVSEADEKVRAANMSDVDRMLAMSDLAKFSQEVCMWQRHGTR